MTNVDLVDIGQRGVAEVKVLRGPIPGYDVCPVTTVDFLDAAECAQTDRVVTVTAEDTVGVRAAGYDVEIVIPTFVDEGVIALATGKNIAVRATFYRVITGTAFDTVLTALTQQDIVAV